MNLLKSTAVVSFFTLLSRISGFVRDMLFARFFGASVWTDAFYVAFKIPNFMRRLFAEGSFSLAFVPVLNEIKAQRSHDYLKQFVNHVFGGLLAVLLVVLGLCELFAPGLVMGFGYGLTEDPDVFAAAVQMLRITLPYLLLISLVAFSAGILNSFGRFALPAATPILLNLSMIWAAIYLRQHFEVPVMAVAWGVLLAGVLQLLVQIPGLMRLGLLPRPVVNYQDPEVKKVMTLMLPTLLGSSVAQVNLLVDTLIATLLPLVGTVTFLYYADRLVEFPLGLFGIAISTVILPRLSNAFASKEEDEYQATIQWGMGLAMLVALPSALGLFLLAEPVILTLFGYEAFSAQDATYTSHALMVYMFGLPAFVANKVLLPAFYSRKDTKSPVKIALKAMLANVILNLVFVAILYQMEVVSLHMGLAMAGVSSAWMQCGWLYAKLKLDGVIMEKLLPVAYVLKLFLALLFMGLVVVLLSGYMGTWHAMPGFERFWRLMIVISAGGAVYLASLWLMKGMKGYL